MHSTSQASCLSSSTRHPCQFRKLQTGSLCDRSSWSVNYYRISACEKLSIVAIPIALKTFSRIVFSFQVQKFFELRIACDDVLCFRKFVIGQVITSTASDREIDESAKRAGGRFDAARCVEGKQIENYTGVGLFAACKKALVIFFDHSHGPVDDGCTIRAQQICCLR